MKGKVTLRRVCILPRSANRMWSVLIFALAFISATRVPAQSNRMNIVFILSDDQTPESVTLMPKVDGRKDWMRFDKNFDNTPLCAPSRATLLSGQYSHHTKVEDNLSGDKFDDTHTLATWMHDGGYYTGYVGKYLNDYPFGDSSYIPPGWDSWTAFYKNVDYFDYTLVEGNKRVNYKHDPADYSTDVLGAKAANFIATAPSDKPFFLVFSPKSCHNPYIPAPRHKGFYHNPPVSIFQRPNCDSIGINPPNWVTQLPRYNCDSGSDERRTEAEMALSLDDAIQGLFDALKAKKILDSTVVIYESDNGYCFGSHRHESKNVEFDEALNVHLYVRYPGSAGRYISKLTTNVDWASTIADIGGVTSRIDIPQDGMSLLPILKGKSITLHDSTGVLLHTLGSNKKMPDVWGIRDDHWKYNVLSSGEKELYNLDTDPYELNNIANDSLDRRKVLAAKLLKLAPKDSTITGVLNFISKWRRGNKAILAYATEDQFVLPAEFSNNEYQLAVYDLAGHFIKNVMIVNRKLLSDDKIPMRSGAYLVKIIMD